MKRSHRFQATVWALFCMSTTPVVVAFAPPFLTRVTPRPLSALQAVHTSALQSTAANPKSNRPTDQQQTELLRQAVELRRLKALQSEAQLQPGSANKKQQPTSWQLARLAGYGDDWEAYEQAWRDGYAAREALVTRNMGLVYYCVNEIMGKRGGPSSLQSLSREDLVQEGAIGLARAVDKWNPAIGGKFSTYAVYWVRAAILRGIAERDDLVRVPSHVLTAVSKMSKAAAQLGINIDGDNLLSSVYSSSKEASWKEAKAAKMLAERAGLTEAQLAQAIKVRERRNQGVASFETWMQKGQDLRSDTATVIGESSAASTATTSANKEFLRQELSRFLRPREMEALSWRYGLLTEGSEPKVSENRSTPTINNAKKNYLARAEKELFGKSPSMTSGGRWGEAMSFTEVGQRMQVSAEYGRRLCHAALMKLRRAAEDGNLSPSLLSL